MADELAALKSKHGVPSVGGFLDVRTIEGTSNFTEPALPGDRRMRVRLPTGGG